MFDLIAAKGLGDALYLRALALHLTECGEAVRVFTGWPEAFSDLPITVKALCDRTGEEDIRHCQYCLHCRLPEVRKGSMFEMACRQAGVFEDVALRMRWEVKNTALVKQVKRAAAGRPIMVYQPLKPAAGHEQKAMQPRADSFRRYVFKSDCFRVKLGILDDDVSSDMNLVGHTSVADAFDVVSAADLVFGEPCYLITLAQAMDKRYVCMFSNRSKTALQSRVREMTPARFFHKPDLGTALYD